MALIFLHIPKTAGTTLSEVILKNYDKTKVFKIGVNTQEYIDWFIAMPQEEQKKIHVIMGHMPFGIHEYISEPYEYITMLRNPVERVISTYFYILRQPVHYLHEYVKSNQLSLEEFVTSKVVDDLDNGQTRRIAGVSVGGLRGKMQVEFGNCSTEILEEAKRNLVNHFTVVGLQEYFDESLLLIKQKLSWKNCFYVSKNISKNKPKDIVISEKVLERIKESNLLDLELYEFAKDLFLQQISNSSQFPYQLKKFRLTNNLYDKGVDFAKSTRSSINYAKSSLKRLSNNF